MKNNPDLSQLTKRHTDCIRDAIRFTAEMMETQEGGERWSSNPNEFVDRIRAAIQNQDMDAEIEEIFW